MTNTFINGLSIFIVIGVIGTTIGILLNKEPITVGITTSILCFIFVLLAQKYQIGKKCILCHRKQEVVE